MTGPDTSRNEGGNPLEALRSMLATMLGGGRLVSGELGRIPAVAEMGRAVALMRQAVGLSVAATATQARLGVAFVRTAERGTGLAYALARAGRRRR
jgi:hypothetical protein